MSRWIRRQRSCQVYPKPTPGDQRGKRWIYTLAKRFLKGSKGKDRRAGNGKRWRYHPIPRDLVLLSRYPVDFPTESPVDPADPTTRGCYVGKQHQCDLRETTCQLQRACVYTEDLGSEIGVISPGHRMLAEHDTSSDSSYYKGPTPADHTPPFGHCCSFSSAWNDRSRSRYFLHKNIEPEEALFEEERGTQCCHRNIACSDGTCRSIFLSDAGEKCRQTDRAVRPSTSAASGRRSRMKPSTRKDERGSASFGRLQLLSTALAGAVCVLFGSSSTVEALYNTSLTFDPPLVGYACEITYSFTSPSNIPQGMFIRLALGGFTSGERNGSAGPDVGFASEEDEGNMAVVWPSDTFHGWWSEGTPEGNFANSLFNIYTMTALSAGTPYTIVIDRASSLKSNCGHEADSTAFFAWADDSLGFRESGNINYSVEHVEEIPVDCYVAQTELTFDPPLPRRKTHVTVAFQPARALKAGDNVTVNLKGFTSGGGDGYPGDDFEIGTLLLSDTSSWLAGWKEGTYVKDQTGYEESMLLLTAKTGIAAGKSQKVIVQQSNGLRAQCGMAENATQSTISVVSASHPPWNTSREFHYSQAVGTGCRELNYCSERGKCDYCLQRCECPPGFGAASDVVDRDIAADCSERTCPAGVSWAPVRLGGYPRAQPDESHTLAECSNMGVCKRSYGQCTCEEGFEGQACERYACPNGCSERGVCRSMRDMAMMEAAIPLVNNDGDESKGFLKTYGWVSQAGTETWESRSVFGCVCDSSWEVGLGSGQTQEAEFFGADCSLMHCPSGDDPETVVDETDCSNKTAPGGRGVGAEGNKCQVDCSNRGLCDHSTGVCSCFDGYHGQACSMKLVDGYGFNTDGM